MKIGFVCDYFYPFEVGGAEKSSYLLAKSLSKHNVKVVVITPNYDAKRYEEKDGFKIYRYCFPLKLKKRRFLRHFYLNNMIFHLYSAWMVCKIAKKEKLDIIHIHNKFSLPGGVLASKWLNLPSMITVRDYYIFCNLSICLLDEKIEINKKCTLNTYLKCLNKFINKNTTNKTALFKVRSYIKAILFDWPHMKLGKFYLKKVDCVVFISNWMKRFYSNMLENQKTEVIYNSMDFNKPSLEKSSDRKYKNLLYVGKLSWGKGIDLLIDSVVVLDGMKKYQWRLDIAGSGPLEGYCKDKVKEYKLEEKIKFKGQLDQKALSELYKNSDITVIPSRWPEPFGRVAIESLSYLTPVVVTDSGGLPEIIENGITGFIVRKDCNKIAEAIKIILNDMDIFKSNIYSRYSQIKNKFETEVYLKYIELYQGLKRY